MSDLLGVMLASALLSEFALHYLIGICPLIAISRKLETAAGLAGVMLCLGPLIATAAFALQRYVLRPAGLDHLALPAFVLLALAIVYGVSAVARAWFPKLWRLAAPFLPLLAVNCSLLGLVLVAVTRAQTLGLAFAQSFGLALGYGFLLVVVAQMRERLAVAEAPRAFQGIPLLLISIGILTMALSGLGNPSD
jgi:electron transport complex protein RnfA